MGKWSDGATDNAVAIVVIGILAMIVFAAIVMGFTL